MRIRKGFELGSNEQDFDRMENEWKPLQVDGGAQTKRELYSSGKGMCPK